MSPLATQGCFRPLCTLARSHGKVEEVCSCQPESNVGSSSGHDVPKHEHARMGMNPLASMMNPFMMQQQQMQQMQQPQQAMAAGGGESSRVPTNPLVGIVSQEVKRIHKENKKTEQGQEQRWRLTDWQPLPVIRLDPEKLHYLAQGPSSCLSIN